MTRSRLFSLFISTFLFCLSMVAQEVEISAHVVDANTNEPLPYVNVFVSPGNGTITNADGDFTININEGEKLRFTYVGYEPLTVTGASIGETIKLKPLALALGEVTVLAQENILISAAKVLDKEYRKKKSERSTYFYRMNTSYRNELVEAFVEANSVGNLRDLVVLKGRRGQATLYGLDEAAISNMNLHHMLELSPRVTDSQFWKKLITPFYLPDYSFYRDFASFFSSSTNSQSPVNIGNIMTVLPPKGMAIANNKSLNHFYDIQTEKLIGQDGSNDIYKITLNSKNNNGRSPILTGTLYIDAKTKYVLRFDGQVENTSLEIIKDFYYETRNLLSKVKINFTHERGFTEVSSIANTLSNGTVTVNTLLYNVEDLSLNKDDTKKDKRQKKRTAKKLASGDNLLSFIDDAGFDAMLWKRSNIVQRTAEEAIAAGVSEQIMLKDSTKTINSDMDMLVDHLTRFGKNLPQEKVYLHMDNTSYFVGDTIWFAAYTRQTNDNMPSQISGVLYVELYNQDGYLVERKLLEMTNGRGYANFVLDKQNYPGYYELRAYTRWQLNWGQYEHFHSKESEKWFLTKDLMQNYLRDYHKLYSRVFPVYDAPKEEGKYDEIMTLRTMRHIFTHDPDNHKMLLTLYPEGGNLVEGLPCRVAYEAAWDNGQALEGTLQGQKSELRGRGSFEVIPEKGLEREVVFTTKEGKEVKAKLPKPEKTGVALKVTQDYDSVYISIHTTADLANAAKGLTIMHEGVLEKFEPISSDSLRMTMPLTDLAEGVNQATVFDDKGRVWADRLFFIRTDETGKPNLTISGVKDSYEPYEQVNLSIKAPNGRGIMSFSVRDASHRNNLYDNASMLTEMLLSSEIKGFVENPEWFFEANDNARNRALDLLLMTQGWRRFDWHEMAVRGEWEMTQVAEKTPVIEGQVYDIPEGEYDSNFEREFEIAKEKSYIDNLVDLHKRLCGFLQTKAQTFKEYDEANAFGMFPLTEEYDTYDTWGGYSFIDKKTNHSIFGVDHLETDFEESHMDNRYSGRSHWQGNVDGIMYGYGSSTKNLSEVRYFPGQKNKAFKNKRLLLHAKMESLDGAQSASKEMFSPDGHFKFQLPLYYGDFILHLAAVDTLHHKKPAVWNTILKEKDQENNWPWYDYSIRVKWPYPRFVKPYNYYQTHLNYEHDPLLRQHVLADGSIQLDNVSVWGKHNVLHAQEDTLPTLIVDAYDAYNQALDDGFLNGRQEYIIRTFVGDYGLVNPYNQGIGYGINNIYGLDVLRRSLNDITTNRDSAYLYQNLKTFKPFNDQGELMMNITERQLRKWYIFQNIDKYVLYTDYQPRLAGSRRYAGSNLPHTRIATYVFPDDSRRLFYKNRRYVLPGFSYVHTFYNPDYSKRKIDEKPKDYRRTLYWNPFLVLDKDGRANILFYNNGSQHKISIDAQGTCSDGTIVVGREM